MVVSNNIEHYNLWLYSRNFHIQFMEIQNLYEAGFYRPAFILLYQLFENIIRSYLEDYECRDTKKLFRLLSYKVDMPDYDKEILYLSDESLREVRNIITHRESSSSSFKYKGIDYLFSELTTYEIIFNYYYPIIDCYINKILDKCDLGML